MEQDKGNLRQVIKIGALHLVTQEHEQSFDAILNMEFLRAFHFFPQKHTNHSIEIVNLLYVRILYTNQLHMIFIYKYLYIGKKSIF